MAGLLKFADLPRSTFYYQQKVSQTPDKEQKVKKQIQRIFDRHHGRYGYRRVTAALGQQGQHINHKKVQRLMNELGLKSLVRPKKYRSYRGEIGQAAENTLDRDFSAANANEKWVTDVTEFNVAGEKLYLSPVMDLYNGEIIAFETARRPAYELVGSMLKKALRKLKSGEKPMRIPIKVGTTGCRPISVYCSKVASSRACHAKETAWTMLPWKASSEY